MRFVALVSGGKDSLYSMMECIKNGHELVGCVHLAAPLSVEEESFMYQTAASEVLPTLVEDCLGVPLILHRREGKSVNTSLVYEQVKLQKNDDAKEDTDANGVTDEVEDLFVALQKAKERFPYVQAVSSGAILSTYQRVRIENVCSRLGLTSLSYLWRLAPQHDLLLRMLNDGIEAVLVKTACPPGLVPQKHLNKTLGTLYYSGLFQRLHDRYQFHMCGEGGEFESLVVDCPLYKKRLVLDEVEIVEADDGGGELVIRKCHGEPKDDADNTTNTPTTTEESKSASSQLPSNRTTSEVAKSKSEEEHHLDRQVQPLAPSPFLPHCHQASGGLLHFSEIMSATVTHTSHTQDCSATEAELAVDEALEVFRVLSLGLKRYHATAKDVLMVHLYLSKISLFANINKHYQDFFGTALPPSRSCVAVGKGVLPGGRRVALDCLVQRGSGPFMRGVSTNFGHSQTDDENNSNNDDAAIINPFAAAALQTKTSDLRKVLHVQSISYWAPVCVGPYSQVNTLRSGLHFLAGQIGLTPASMTLRKTWQEQLEQCWTNIASVLDALDGNSLDSLLSCLVYVSSAVDDWETVEAICRKQLQVNGSIVPGAVESTASTAEAYGGYEDEGTWREMVSLEAKTKKPKVPLLIVGISEMPVGSLIEVETICATKRATNYLDIERGSCGSVRNDNNKTSQEAIVSNDNASLSDVDWDTGHDFAPAQHKDDGSTDSSLGFDAITVFFGTSCAAICTAFASMPESLSATPIDLDNSVTGLVRTAVESLDGASLSYRHILHVRLYYIGRSQHGGVGSGDVLLLNDGIRIRASLASALARVGDNSKQSTPAYTVIPVSSIAVIDLSLPRPSDRSLFMAIQMLSIDPVHMETELWIHCREQE